MATGAERVLLAEDEPGMLFLLEKLFLRRGYQILRATNGQEALDIYRRHKDEIAVILLDMGLPKISGRDVLHQIRSENPDAKVIVTSGYIEPELKLEIERPNVKFLQKPYTPDSVFAALQSLAETPRSSST
ncbi:MAG TPA: response regulator [Candidatus Binatia bacterium]|jgi:CheY-like chemotaxis protein